MGIEIRAEERAAMGMEIAATSIRVFVCCLVFAYFVIIPLESRYRYSKLKTALLISSLIFITILVTILFLTTGHFLSDYSTIGILIWIASAILIFRLAMKGSGYEILFIVLVVLNLYVNIAAIAKVVVDVMELRAVHGSIYSLIIIIVTVLYIPLFYELLQKRYRMVVELDIRTSFWKIIWIMPALTYMIFYIKIIRDYWRSLTVVGTDDIIFIILWSFTTYAFFWVTLEMLIQMYQGVTAVEQAKTIVAQLRMQQEQYERMLNNIESTARLRHDWRHHMILLNGFVEIQDFKSLENYIKKLVPEYVTGEGGAICLNHVVDVILRHYKAIAKTLNVNVNIKADIPKEIPISDVDLCIVFGNLVENAVDACRDQKCREKKIEVKAEMKSGQLVAMIKNTCDPDVVYRDGVNESTKHPGAGIGLPSVRKVVEKYKGSMKIDVGSEFFSVYVLLNAGDRKNALINDTNPG